MLSPHGCSDTFKGTDPGRTGVRVSDLGELRSTVPSCTGEGVEVLQTRLILNRSTSAAAAAAAAAVAEIDVTVMAVEEREVYR
jgi:hypothetical protein